MTFISSLFRTLGELNSLMASPTEGNIEAARKIVGDLCRDAGIQEMASAQPAIIPRNDK